MKRKIFLTLSISALLAAAPFEAHAYQSGDFQMWNTTGQEVKIGKETKLVMEQEYRFGENASELFYQHYDWGVAYSFDKRLEIACGYRLVLERVKRKWMEGDEPFVNITGKLDVWKFKVEDRNRIEYRHFRFAPDQARYRNKLTIKYPFDFHKITIAPYISNEIFVSSNGTGFNQNRLHPGIEFGLTKYVKADIGYMSQSVKIKDHKWFNANVLWTKLKISF